MSQYCAFRVHRGRSAPVQGRMAVSGLLAGLVALLVFSSDSRAQTRRTTPDFNGAVAANQIVSLTNRQRVQRGLPPLKVDSHCVRAITSHVEDMARGGFLSHEGRDGRGANARYRQYRPASRGAGENLAYNTTGTGDSFMRQWMGSSGHRNNILSGNYKGIGVAVRVRCSGGDERTCYYYAGQCFSL